MLRPVPGDDLVGACVQGVGPERLRLREIGLGRAGGEIGTGSVGREERVEVLASWADDRSVKGEEMRHVVAIVSDREAGLDDVAEGCGSRRVRADALREAQVEVNGVGWGILLEEEAGPVSPVVSLTSCAASSSSKLGAVSGTLQS